MNYGLFGQSAADGLRSCSEVAAASYGLFRQSAAGWIAELLRGWWLGINNILVGQSVV